MAKAHVSKAQHIVRREAAESLRKLLDDGMPRKKAFLAVSKTLRDLGLPHSQRSIYSWCAEFGVKTS